MGAPKISPVRRRGLPPVRLPGEGRTGKAPKWPLSSPPSAAERQVWASLWALPQATMWERMGVVRPVARFVRLTVACDGPDAAAALHGAEQALGDRLGMSPRALHLLGWVIAPDEVAEQRVTKSSARGRIRAVDPELPA